MDELNDDLNDNLVNLNRSQINKLKRGGTITLKPENFNNGNISLKLDKENQKKVERNIRRGKGVRVNLSRKELRGNGFFDTIKNVGKAILPVVAKPLVGMAQTAATSLGGPVAGAVVGALGNQAVKAVGGKGIVIKPIRAMDGPITIKGRGRGRRKGGSLFSKKNLNKLKDKATPLIKDLGKKGLKMATNEGAKILKEKGVPADLVNVAKKDITNMIDNEKLIIPKDTLLEGLDEVSTRARQKIEGMGANVYGSPMYMKTMKHIKSGGNLMTLSPYLSINNPAMTPYIGENQHQGYNPIKKGKGMYPAGMRVGRGFMSPYQSVGSPAMQPFVELNNPYQGYNPIKKRGRGMYPSG